MGKRMSIDISRLLVTVFLFLPISWTVFGAQLPAAINILILLFLIRKNHGGLPIIREILTLPILVVYTYFGIRYTQSGYFLGFLNFLSGTLLTTYIIVLYIDTEHKYKAMLKRLVNCALVYAVLVIVEAFTRLNLFDLILGRIYGAQEQMVRFGIYRPRGMCTMTINNCIVLCFVASLIAYYMFVSERVTLVDKISYVLTIVAALLTLSRAGIIMLALTQLYIGVSTGFIKNAKRLIYGVLGLIVCIATVYIFNIKVVKNIVQQFYLMFAVVFNDSLSNSLSSNFGANPNGIGHRELLYDWVTEAVRNKGNELWGLGMNVQFQYRLSQSTVKTSIENYYLASYFSAGQVAVVLIGIAFASIIIYAFANRHLKIVPGNCSINSILIVLMVCYVVVLTTVSATDDLRALCLFIGFAIAHNRICKRDGIPYNSNQL